MPASAGIGTSGICDLIAELQGIFAILRTLAFIGAGFILASKAWSLISSGKLGDKDFNVEGIKSVGVPMLIGFILLFSIGVILQIFSSVTGAELLGCSEQVFQGW